MNIPSNTCRLLTASCFFLTGYAQANLLTNGSFENTNSTFVGDGNSVQVLLSGSTVIPGWTMTNGVPTAWLKNGNPYAISASNGQFFLDLTSYANSGTYGGVTQTFATTAGVAYALTFDLGYGGNSSGFGGPVSVGVTAAGSSGTFTSGSGSPNPAVWNTKTFNFTATSSTTQLTITGLSTAGGFYIGLDNADVEVATVGAVPEPSTIYLLGTVLVALAFLRNRLPSSSVR
jgi:hypothetical protein